MRRPNRDAKPKTFPCMACGVTVTRTVSPSRLVNGQTCSYWCRYFKHHGKWPSSKWTAPPTSLMLWVPQPPPEPKPRTFAGHICDDCGEHFLRDIAVNGLIDRYCSKRCRRRVAKRRRRAREHDAPGELRWIEVIAVFIAFDRCCAYCEQPIAGQPDPDHVVPLSRGGRNDISNVLPCCRLCNADKNDMTLDEWVTDRRRRERPAVTTTWAANDPRTRHLIRGKANGKAYRNKVRTAA